METELLVGLVIFGLFVIAYVILIFFVKINYKNYIVVEIKSLNFYGDTVESKFYIQYEVLVFNKFSFYRDFYTEDRIRLFSSKEKALEEYHKKVVKEIEIEHQS